MAGIYLHIPFCKRRCHYCNFYALASKRYRPEFVDRLIKETESRKGYLAGQEIGSIYFGGGTPSLLSADELNRIFDCLNRNFRLEANCEITLEANPDDVSREWISSLKHTPVNRISMGVQSFRDEDLRYLNRIHGSGDAITAVKKLQDKGYHNLTIDLIYGIPGLSIPAWEENLTTFFSLDLQHLSAYALTVEERTPLHVLIARQKMEAPDENATVDHFRRLQELTEEMGYLHYEISNFAREGHYSRHNTIYWTGGHYLGLGPSAHSFNGHSRRWNVSSIKQWIENPDDFSETFEEEVLSKEHRYNEYVMTSLRTMWGCSIAMVRTEFGEEYVAYLLEESRPHILTEKLVIRNDTLYLSRKGKLFADGIASDLFR